MVELPSTKIAVGKFGQETINNNGHGLTKICQQHKLKI